MSAGPETGRAAALPVGGPGALGAPWSSGVRRRADGRVEVAGVPASELAAAHGTPAYVLDEADFRARARAYRSAFEAAFEQVGAGVDVYYAGKALLTVAVARWATQEGLRVDTASGGELAVALRAGVPGTSIGLHGNNKSDGEILAALDAGVGRLIVDSLVEIERVADLAASRGGRAPVMVRVTTGVHAGGHEYISTAHEDQKFGLSVNPGPDGGTSPALAALEAVVARPELELLGIHSHIGSQILEPSGFEAAARVVLQLRADLASRTGVLVEEVDLGGGYGIAYLPTSEILAHVGEWPATFIGRGLWDFSGGLEGTLDLYERASEPKELVVVRGPHSEIRYGAENVRHMQERMAAFATAVMKGEERIPGAASFSDLRELVVGSPPHWEPSNDPAG